MKDLTENQERAAKNKHSLPAKAGKYSLPEATNQICPKDSKAVFEDARTVDVQNPAPPRMY